MIFKRIVSLGLGGCLVALSPGSGFYSVLGQVTTQWSASRAVNTPIAVTTLVNPRPASHLDLTPGQLTGFNLPSISLPGAQFGAGDAVVGLRRGMEGLEVSARPVLRNRPPRVTVVSPGAAKESKAPNIEGVTFQKALFGKGLEKGGLETSGTNSRSVSRKILSIAKVLGFFRGAGENIAVWAGDGYLLPVAGPALGANATKGPQRDLRHQGSDERTDTRPGVLREKILLLRESLKRGRAKAPVNWRRALVPVGVFVMGLLAARFLPCDSDMLFLLVAVSGAVCVTFKTLEETEAGQVGFRDENSRHRAMQELSRISREFGRQVEKESRDPKIHTQVSAELVARSGQKAMAYAMDAFLDAVRKDPPKNPAAAVRLFKSTVKEGLVDTLKMYGLSADPEKAIRAIVEKTGVLAKIVTWQKKHKFVATILERAGSDEKSSDNRSEAGKGKKTRSLGSKGGANLILLLAVVATWVLFRNLGLFPSETVSGLLGMALVSGALRRSPKSANTGKPLEHRLEAWLQHEDIAFLLQITTEIEPDLDRPLVGRTNEVRRVLDSLSKPKGLSRSVLLTGRRGIGKRAIVEHIAGGIHEGRYKGLKDTVVLELDPSRLIGTQIESAAQQLRQVLVKTRGRVILYIPNAGQLKAARLGVDDYAFFRILNPEMSKGRVTMIVSSQPSERARLRADGAFSEAISLDESSEEQAEEMVAAHKQTLRNLFGLRIEPGVVKTAVHLAARYIHEAGLPGSAFKLLEKALARRTPAAEKNYRAALVRQLTHRLLEYMNRYQRLSQEGVADPERLDRIYNAIVRTVEHLMRLTEEARTDSDKPPRPLSADDLAETVSELTRIPTSRVLKDEAAKLRTLEEDLGKRVVHQDQAVSAVARAIRRARAGLKDPAKPIGSFLFVGPTGVGKTELAKSLAELLFDDEKNLIRIDMSEYKEPHSVARLSGTHPGYVGFEEGGQLTEAVRKRPYAVVLLDEIEKAHPEVLDLLLQIMDDGRLTDGHGNTVRFSNVILIMTSNLGSDYIQRAIEQKTDAAEIRKAVDRAIKENMRPEFINRLTEIVQFDALDEKAAEDVTELHLRNKVSLWLRERDSESDINLRFPIPREVLQILVRKGFNRVYGGRSLVRTVERMLLDPLAPKLLERGSEDGGPGLQVSLEARGDSIGFSIEPLPSKPVERLNLADAETRELIEELLKREEPLTLQELEVWLLGDPETAISREPMGAFHPMSRPLEKKVVEERVSESDNPDLKDSTQEAIHDEWPGRLSMGLAEAEAFARWYDKTLRCAKSTNYKKRGGNSDEAGPESSEGRVITRWVRTPTHDEIQVHSLPLTRAELLETAQIFENHFRQDSTSEDESWDLADALINRGLYGRAELFEVKRLISAVPGATFGFWSDRSQLVFWLHLPRADAGSDFAAGSGALPEDTSASGRTSDAAGLYRTLTQGESPKTEKIRALITRWLDSNNPIVVYQGFLAAKATLTEKAFSGLVNHIPSLKFLPTGLAHRYRENILGTSNKAARDSKDMETLIGEILNRSYVTRLKSARMLASRPQSVKPAQRARVLEELLSKYPQRIHRARWVRRAVVYGGFTLLGLAPYLILHWIFPGLPFFFSINHWVRHVLHPVFALAALILGLLMSRGSFFDIAMRREVVALREYGHGLEITAVLAPIFSVEERRRLHAIREDYIRKAFYRKRAYSGYAETNAVWQAKMAASLALESQTLAPELRRAVAAKLMQDAEEESRHPKRANVSVQRKRWYGSVNALLSGFDLLDESQKLRALELFIELNRFRHSDLSDSLETMADLVKAGKIPDSMKPGLLDWFVEMIRKDGGYSSVPNEYEPLPGLAEGLSQKDKDSLARTIWETREYQYRDDHLAALFEALLTLSPGPRLARTLADSALKIDSTDNVLQAIRWLLQNAAEYLDAGRKKRLNAVILKEARDGDLTAFTMVGSLKELPWKERLDILISAQSGLGDGSLKIEEFIEAFARCYRDASSAAPQEK